MAGAPLPNVSLPNLTMPTHQTKNQWSLHEETPTKPYQDLCPRCETAWGIWFGRPVFTNRYQPCDLAWTLQGVGITNHRPPPEGITHSDDDYVLGRHTADTTHRMKTLCKLMNYV